MNGWRILNRKGRRDATGVPTQEANRIAVSQRTLQDGLFETCGSSDQLSSLTLAMWQLVEMLR